MNDDLVKRWNEYVESMGGLWAKSDSEKQVLLGRIEELEAKLTKAVEGLIVIDAINPEGLIEGCSQSALTSLVLRMGEIARTTIESIKGDAE